LVAFRPFAPPARPDSARSFAQTAGRAGNRPRGVQGLDRRTVVIIQDDRFDATDSVAVCAFTTDPTEAPLIRLPIVPDEQNGLREASSLMVDKITTLPRSKLGEQIGRLKD
jgi:mRNA-degrading endonuclease toxin of MazEF toxin-antitoxin module